MKVNYLMFCVRICPCIQEDLHLKILLIIIKKIKICNHYKLYRSNKYQTRFNFIPTNQFVFIILFLVISNITTPFFHSISSLARAYFSWCSNYKTWNNIFNSIFYVNHPICVFSLHTIQHSVQIIDSMWVYIALWFSTKIVSSIQWKDTIVHRKLK